ncbi:hypothetical protein LshimejAT787_0705230 [Lyophyllum shimeji]|uniref:Uncharacterized protein n=1 Tax=Lyophyllum shimeji TaxID=47721 RepID=A0A9P3UNT9_LYOSH|nr:hypothetical protein LshimejAT787_0705230 [Lyophyllum shimeji]
MACQSVITYGCLACSLLTCLTAADILNRNTLKAIHRGVTVLVTPSPAVQLFHFIVACNFVIIGIDLSDRLLVQPRELIVTYDRLRILANGQTRREVGHERMGIKEVKTIAFMAVIFCASGMILCGVAENIFPDLGPLIVPVVFMVIMIIRDAYLIYTSTLRKPMLRAGVLPEIIVDPGNHAFEFIIDGGDDLVDLNEEVRGGGDNGNGDNDNSIYRHKFNPADRSGGKGEERKGIG